MTKLKEAVLDVYGKGANNVYLEFMNAAVEAWEPESREAYAELFNDLKSGNAQNILEVGVGTGRNIHRYPESASLTGVDLTPEMLDVAKEKAKELGRDDIRLEVTDASGLPFDDDTFDAVVATYVLCTTEDPEKVFNEMVRVCKPGGKIAIYDVKQSTTDHHILKHQHFLESTARTVGLYFNDKPAVVYNILFDLEGLVQNSGLKVLKQAILEFGPIECIGMFILEK